MSKDTGFENEKGDGMKIAVPTLEGKLCPHFGHCAEFAIFEVEDGKIVGKEMAEPPPHEPGVLPKWLGEEKKVDVIIAGGMGVRAQQLFAAKNIEVVVGAPADDAEKAVEAWLAGTLETGANLCDH
jgi:predicted Fe-Mo cluster-binding NifX family protein